MSINDEIRAIVRDELGKLLGDAPDAARVARPITDLDRARARAALKRLGVALPGEPTKALITR